MRRGYDGLSSVGESIPLLVRVVFMPQMPAGEGAPGPAVVRGKPSPIWLRAMRFEFLNARGVNFTPHLVHDGIDLGGGWAGRAFDFHGVGSTGLGIG